MSGMAQEAIRGARLLVTRPPEESRRLAEKLLALPGVAAVDTQPLFVVEYAPPAADLKPADFAALLFTSANGVKNFGRAFPAGSQTVYAVGEATAEAARKLGFRDVHAAGGDVEKLSQIVRQSRRPDQGALLHVAGETLAGDLKASLEAEGFAVRRETFYRAAPLDRLNPTEAARFEAGEYRAALFFSPRSAAIFVGLAEKAGLARAAASCAAIALSQNVAAALAPLPWRAIRTAVHPEETAMIAAVGAELLHRGRPVKKQA